MMFSCRKGVCFVFGMLRALMISFTGDETVEREGVVGLRYILCDRSMSTFRLL